MIDYGLRNKVAMITGTNNPQGIGATTALAFAREDVKVILVYKKIFRHFDKNNTHKNETDRYFESNSKNADIVENKLKKITTDYIILVGKYGITVNCVSPGPTQTGWIDETLENSIIPQIPMGK